MRTRAGLLAVVLALLAAGTCSGILSPDGEAFSVAFDPPYDDTTLKVQLKVSRWWGPLSDTAVIPKGTKVPVVEDDCADKPSTCRAWTVPGDVTLQLTTPTAREAHRLSRCPPASSRALMFVGGDPDSYIVCLVLQTFF